MRFHPPLCQQNHAYRAGDEPGKEIPNQLQNQLLPLRIVIIMGIFLAALRPRLSPTGWCLFPLTVFHLMKNVEKSQMALREENTGRNCDQDQVLNPYDFRSVKSCPVAPQFPAVPLVLPYRPFLSFTDNVIALMVSTFSLFCFVMFLLPCLIVFAFVMASWVPVLTSFAGTSMTIIPVKLTHQFPHFPKL